MRPWLKLALWGVALAVLVGLAYLLFNSSTVRLEGSSLQDASLTFEMTLPQATCRKRFSPDFPFVELDCAPLTPNPGSGTP